MALAVIDISPASAEISDRVELQWIQRIQ